MVKHLNGWEMSKKLNANCKVFVKTFSGAKTTCMNDYVKPSINSFLGKLCKEKNYYLIDHSMGIKRNHLNKGKFI